MSALVGAILIGAGVALLRHRPSTYLSPVSPVRITSPFGDRINPITGEAQFHNGVDLAATVGTPVLAPWDGVTRPPYHTDAGGLQILVDMDDGTRAGFAHLSDALGGGIRVKRGDVVAYTGASGNVTGPHLHFSLKRDGVYIDPEPYLHTDAVA